MRFKLIGIVVTYYPDDNLLSNIQCYIDDLDALIVWENTPAHETIIINSYRTALEGISDKLLFLGTGENVGISKALNNGLKYAKDNGYTHILTMDQDSKWDNFKKYKNWAQTHVNDICGPNINCYDSLSEIECEYLITSGTIVPVKILCNIGGWDETLAIDGVDEEMCLRAKLSGIKCYKGGDLLIQRYGTPKSYRFRGSIVQVNEYSPFRLKSIVESHIFIMRKYKTSSNYKNNFLFFLMQKIKTILLFEEFKVEKFRAIIKGVLAGVIRK